MLNFVVDTGAGVSIIPVRYATGITLVPTPVTLNTATGSKIECFGQAKVEIQFPDLRRNFTWTFIIAETTVPLLGFDFLENFGIIINCKERKLLDSTTGKFISLNRTSSKPVNIVVNSSVPLNVSNLLKQYPSLISPHDNQDSNYCGVYHRINTGDNVPVFSKTRQLSEDKFKVAQEEFRKMSNSGVISLSKSDWSSPLHMVKKPNGQF